MPPVSTNLNPASQKSGTSSKQNLILCLLLSAISLLLYNRVASAGFINFDDPQYVLNNAHVRQGITWDTFKWAFTTYEAGNWHPLTWLSHALDWRLFQLNPAGHHYVNVLFHTANSVLLFLVLLSATRRKWPSWTIALLWAVHPVNVESVAWVAERKNLLSMFFFLLGLYAYGKFARKQTIGRYGAVTLFFALGLMAKPQVITFPLLLLLWDYWPLQRMKPFDSDAPSLPWLIAEKIPLFLLSAASAWITMQAQRFGDAVRTTAEFSVSARIENALVSYVRYIGIAVWPSRLSPIYPHPENAIPLWQAGAAAAVLLIVTGMVLWQEQRRYLLVGWLWFLGTLVPMIGLVQVGQQAMADRYAYLPFVGLFIAVVFAVAELLDRQNLNPAVALTLLATIAILLSAVTYRQLGYWHSSETLWTRALAVTARNYTAHSNLADILARTGRSQEAIMHFEAAEQLHAYEPGEVLALAIYEQQNDHVEGAIRQFQMVLNSCDDSLKAAAFAHLGAIYSRRGNLALAAENYGQALKLDPNQPIALLGSGLMAYRDNPQQAATLFSRLLTVQPSDVGLLLLSASLRSAGHKIESDAAYERARRISPNLGQAQAAANQLLNLKGTVSK